MSETPASAPAPASAPGPASLGALRRALRVGFVAAAVALPVAVVIGWLVAGGPGVWGALIGLAVPVAFLSVTALVGVGTARMAPSTMGIVVLGSWLLKVVLLLVVLVALRDQDFYSRGVLGGVLLTATVGYLVLEALVVVRTRAPYVEPDAGRGPGAPGPAA